MAGDEERIRQLAYELWKARGCPEGSAEQDWYAAQQRLHGERRADSQAVDETVKESFPASDPPAPPLPDNPPSNADEKWAAAEAAQSKRRGKKSEPKTESEQAGGRARRNGRSGRDVTPS